MKTCNFCKESKPLDSFSSYKENADGKRGYCKTCDAAKQRERRKDPAVVLTNRHRDRAYREANREHLHALRLARAVPASRKFDPYKKRARHALLRAVKRGKIIKPEACSDCGQIDNVHGHHADYSKRFEVEWLCSQCHGKRHRLEDDQFRVTVGGGAAVQFTIERIR